MRKEAAGGGWGWGGAELPNCSVCLSVDPLGVLELLASEHFRIFSFRKAVYCTTSPMLLQV